MINQSACVICLGHIINDIIGNFAYILHYSTFFYSALFPFSQFHEKYFISIYTINHPKIAVFNGIDFIFATFLFSADTDFCDYPQCVCYYKNDPCPSGTSDCSDTKHCTVDTNKPCCYVKRTYILRTCVQTTADKNIIQRCKYTGIAKALDVLRVICSDAILTLASQKRHRFVASCLSYGLATAR